MNYEFSLLHNEQNYLAANRLHFWATVRSKKGLRAVAFIWVIYFILGLGAMLINHDKFDGLQLIKIAGIALALGAVVLVACYAIGYFTLGYRTRKLFAQQKLFHIRQDFTVTEEALLVSSELFNTTLPYGHAHKWAENASTFLVFHSDLTFQYFPKDEVPLDAISMLRTKLIAANCTGRSF
jgi:hypothetical protein